jgi:flagellar biosynthetic protein FliR
MARVGGLMVAAPLLGNRAVPATVKAGFALVFTLALVPLAAPSVGPIPNHLLLLALYVVKDVVFGMALGFVARLLFSAVEMAGYFMDTQMGFGFINLINPFSEQQSSLMSMFQYQLAITVYLLANGHIALLGSMAESFHSVPPGAVAPAADFGMKIVPLLQLMFTIGFKLALPAAGVLLVVDVAFGLVARMVPQLNVFIVGLPAKIIIGLTTVALVLPIIALIVGQIMLGTTAGLHSLK